MCTFQAHISTVYSTAIIHYFTPESTNYCSVNHDFPNKAIAFMMLRTLQPILYHLQINQQLSNLPLSHATLSIPTICCMSLAA